MTDVSIDRLVLDLPGIDAAAARSLALGIAEGLAAVDFGGTYPAMQVVVDPAMASQPQRLAAHIVQTLLSRIG